MYTNDPVQMFTHASFLMLATCGATTFLWLGIVLHLSLVPLEQLDFLLFFRKILQVLQIVCFSDDVEMNFITTEGLVNNYYTRCKRSLMLRKKTPPALAFQRWL